MRLAGEVDARNGLFTLRNVRSMIDCIRFTCTARAVCGVTTSALRPTRVTLPLRAGRENIPSR